MALKHLLVATDPQSPLVGSSDWNAAHVIDSSGLTFNDASIQTVAYTGTAFPSQGGNSGKFLTTDGSVLSWGAPAGSGTVTTTGSPANGNLSKFSGGSSITNGDLSGDVTTSGALVATIANSVVTLAKIANAAANSKLLGSGAAGSGAAYSELTLGTGLSMSGTTLNTSIDAGNLTGATLAAGVVASSLTSVGTLTSLAVAGTVTVTSTSAAALTVGANGATNPVLTVNANTGSQVGGISIVGAVTGGTTTITATDSGSNHGLTISSKGSGNLTLKGTGSATALQAGGSTQITLGTSQQIYTNSARNSTANTAQLFTGIASGTGASSLTAGSEVHSLHGNFAATQTHASNTAITLQRDVRVTPSTHAFQTATGTITDAVAFAVDSAPVLGTNAAITNASTIYSAGANVGAATSSFGLNITANSGAGTNWAAQLVGNTINTGTIGPSASQQHTMPAVASDTFALIAASQTFTNKTLTSPTLTTPSAFTTGGTITLAENTGIALDPAGSADGKWSGITMTGTAGYTQTYGDLVYLDPTDSRWEAADANSAAGADGDARGNLAMVVVAGTDGTSCTLLKYGNIRADAAFPTFTVNNPIYVSETAGAVTQTQPTTTDVVIRIIGAALTADEMFFNPDNSWITHT